MSGLGFASTIYEFAVKSFLVGSWQPVHVVSSALGAFQGDIRMQLIAALSMAASLASIKNEQEKACAEEDVVGHIMRTMEPIRKAPGRLFLNSLSTILTNPSPHVYGLQKQIDH